MHGKGSTGSKIDDPLCNIYNGPKEDKTAEVKAPERGEKSSIMDRLKSAKAEKQKECCPPKKHKGEIEL